MLSDWLGLRPSTATPVDVLSGARSQCREGSSWGRFRTGRPMWSKARPGSAKARLLVTSFTSSAESRAVASEVIAQLLTARSVGWRRERGVARVASGLFSAWVAPPERVWAFLPENALQPDRREPWRGPTRGGFQLLNGIGESRRSLASGKVAAPATGSTARPACGRLHGKRSHASALRQAEARRVLQRRTRRPAGDHRLDPAASTGASRVGWAVVSGWPACRLGIVPGWAATRIRWTR